MLLPRTIVGIVLTGLATVGAGLPPFLAQAADPPQVVITAPTLASQLGAIREEGSAFVKLRAEVKQPSANTNSVLQIQIKSRRTAKRTELVYQLLWPKERKGESILLVKSGGNAPTGTHFVPPGTMQTLDAAKLKGSLFGTDLAIEDLVEDCYSWKRQVFAGTEVVDGVNCQILESRPGPDEWSGCAKTRSWVDLKRTVPLRVEKYSSSGALIQRLDTRKVVKDKGHHVPCQFMVYQPGRDSLTEFEYVRGDRDVAYADSDFTPEGLRQLAPPRLRSE